MTDDLEYRRFVDFRDFLLLEHGLSDSTIGSYTSDIKQFNNYLREHNEKLEPVTFDKINGYLKFCTDYKSSSMARFMCSMRAYCKFLVKNSLLESNPCALIESPKLLRIIPKSMSEECVEAFLNIPDLGKHTGLRDKAMLELIYSTGLRISELISLRFEHVNFANGFIRIIGKGDKERMVPLGENAAYWIETYVNSLRHSKDPKRKCPFIFLSGKGLGPMTRIAFWYRIKVYCQELGITKDISPHSFRHAFATHLLNHDADLRSVQMLLGHSSLTTTQIYTYVATKRMHDVFESAHPLG
jgi:integrase/recombinase XerD